MRKKIKPIFVIAFFLFFTGLILVTRGYAQSTSQDLTQPSTTTGVLSTSSEVSSSTAAYSASPVYIEDPLEMKPIIDVSGWQLPADMDYDVLAANISGVIVRVQSGSHTKKDNNASDKNGLDKSFKTHIKEFQARGIPVAVYAYVTGNSEKKMKAEAKTFYEAASPYHPTFYWLDVEEKTMDDMNAGVEAFRQELVDLGAKNIGIYIGTYFMEEHSISTEKFDSVWIPTYGNDSGYYDAAPNTNLDYDLHQYTSRGYVNGFRHHLDLNLITPLKEPNAVYQKLFTVPEK
ncbi:glycosyl hydrolase family 25 [Streptococcus sp. X16XC17]|uniref:glycoside hydrolase family 25 protein n=1 Tax=unclassified Streptococcus TaxID=2608887 RepID=UPI00066FCFB4|nr:MULTISPECIES: glycoside hydrolase family 25 protein [unclassified Streptococcus]TCD46710.1 glycosyl hydrolase family 25 [Streptococcus sp. X16XC17]